LIAAGGLRPEEAAPRSEEADRIAAELDLDGR